MQKALLIRMDRIGDLVLTLPMDRHSGLKNYAVRWWVSPVNAAVASLAEPTRDYEVHERKTGFKTFIKELKDLRKENFDLALVFYAPFWVYLLLFLARVPIRGGRKSQWYSFFFLNRGLRQKRSLSEKHEFQYNNELADFVLEEQDQIKDVLNFSAGSSDVVSRHNLTPTKYYVVHPGMAKSAKNWSATNFIKLIERLASQEVTVITGTEADSQFLEPIVNALKGKNNVVFLNGQLSLTELIAVLNFAKGVVAPSTGVVHLAASLGVPTVGIYSDVKEESARRWGPLGLRATSLSPPEVDLSGQEDDPMEGYREIKGISVEKVVESLKELET